MDTDGVEVSVRRHFRFDRNAGAFAHRRSVDPLKAGMDCCAAAASMARTPVTQRTRSLLTRFPYSQ